MEIIFEISFSIGGDEKLKETITIENGEKAVLKDAMIAALQKSKDIFQTKITELVDAEEEE